MFDFTRQERGAILFILFLALVGLGISMLAKTFTVVRKAVYMSEDIARINLNSADKETLMLIPGVGDKIACRIIQHRNQQGVFKDVDDLLSIKGINKRNFDKIKGLVYAGER